MGVLNLTQLKSHTTVNLFGCAAILFTLLAHTTCSPAQPSRTFHALQRRSADPETRVEPEPLESKAFGDDMRKKSSENQKKKTPEDHKKELHDPKKINFLEKDDYDLYDEDLTTDYDVHLDMQDSDDFERLLSLLSRSAPAHQEESVHHSSKFLDRHDELVHPSHPPPSAAHMEHLPPISHQAYSDAESSSNYEYHAEDVEVEDMEEEEEEEQSEDQERLEALYLKQMVGGQSGAGRGGVGVVVVVVMAVMVVLL